MPSVFVTVPRRCDWDNWIDDVGMIVSLGQRQNSFHEPSSAGDEVADNGRIGIGNSEFRSWGDEIENRTKVAIKAVTFVKHNCPNRLSCCNRGCSILNPLIVF